MNKVFHKKEMMIKKAESVKQSFFEFIKKPIRVFIKVSYRQLTNHLRKSESRFLGFIILKVTLK